MGRGSFSLAPLWLKVKLLELFLKGTLSRNVLRGGESVAILGNGPSLSEVDLIECVGARDVIVMNRFYEYGLHRELKIVCYCFGEPGFYDMNDYLLDRIFDVDAGSYWFHYSQIPNKCLNRENVHFYLTGGNEQLERHGNIELTRAAPDYASTAQMALFIALSMGYREIELYGHDHDMLTVLPSTRYSTHFYKEDNYSDRSDLFFGGGDYHALIKNCDKLWAMYKKIKHYAAKKEIIIRNKTKDSYLDMFEE